VNSLQVPGVKAASNRRSMKLGKAKDSGICRSFQKSGGSVMPSLFLSTPVPGIVKSVASIIFCPLLSSWMFSRALLECRMIRAGSRCQCRLGVPVL